MNPNLFLLFGLYILAFGCAFLLGKLIWNYYFEKNGVYLSGNFFIQFIQILLFGTTLLITLISFYITNFITINLLTIPVLICFPFLVKRFGGLGEKENKLHIKYNALNYLILFLTTSLIFVFHFLYSEHAFTGDFLYNSKLSQALVDSGIESGLGLYHHYISNTGISLYHFGLLYFNSFLITFTNQNAYELLMYVTHPFFHSLGWIAFMGFVYSFFPNKKWFSLLLSFGFFYGLSSLSIQQNIIDAFSIHHWYYYGIPMFASTKMLILYPFVFLGFYYAVIKNNITALMLLLSILMVFYLTIFVSIIGASVLMILLLIGKKLRHKKTVLSFDFILQLIPFFIPLFIGIGMFGLNHLMGASHSEAGVDNVRHSIYGISTYWGQKWEYLTALIKYMFLPYLMYPLLTFLAIYSILFAFKFTKTKIILFLLFSLIVPGVFITLFEDTIADSTQALSNILSPLVLVFAVLLFSFIKSSIGQKIILGITLILCVSNIYKQTKGSAYVFTTFEQKVFEWGKEESSKQPFFKWAYCSNRYWSTWHINDDILRNPLVRLNNTVLPIEIAPLFANQNERLAYCKKNPKSPICVFCNDNENKFSYQDILKLLKSLDIKYVYFEEEFVDANEEFLRNFEEIIIDEKRQGIYNFK